MLESFSDFLKFKEEMLFYKKSKLIKKDDY